MNTSVLLSAQSAGAAGGGMEMLVMMLVIIVIMWFFMIRPQQKKQKEIRNFQNSLREGVRVVTGGGIYGTVKRIDIEKGKVEVEIARGVTVEVDKSYIFADSSALMQSPSSNDIK